jgi:CheY-like chemotaxis protein
MAADHRSGDSPPVKQDEADPEYDLVLLDLNLPDGNGFDLSSWIRSQNPCQISGSGPRVLMLTARNQLRDRVRGLDLGTARWDGYLEFQRRPEPRLACFASTFPEPEAPQAPFASGSSWEPATASPLTRAQEVRAMMGSLSVCPSSVRLYSTRGGASAYTCRSTSPCC